MAEPQTPILIQPIPPIVVVEGTDIDSIDFTHYVGFAEIEDDTGLLKFHAELTNGKPLPKDLTCSSLGLLTGVIANHTMGNYEIKLTATSETGQVFETKFNFTVVPRPGMDASYLSDIKNQVWEALGKNQPMPDMADIFNLPITTNDIYYLMQRFASLAIWDVYNLESPGDKVLLSLPGSSPHYNIYDRGCCLVGAPKDLFSHERTLADALQTARVMASEVYKRGWTIEFAGFNKMVRAAWVELQLQGSASGKFLEILHYSPSVGDIKLSNIEVQMRGPSL